MKKKDLPLDITSKCYIDDYEGNFCLFYNKVPLIVVNYEFWTEDIKIKVDYINYGDNEKGYSVLIDVPYYNEGKLINIDHVYYGLFKSLSEIDIWLKDPYFLY